MKQKSTLRFPIIQFIPCLLLIGGALLSILRTIFMGLDIDEQYAVTLAYRMASGDRMIAEMWEPHQTSVLIPALFIRIFSMFMPDLEYLVLFLRACGTMTRMLIALFWYSTFKKDYGFLPSFLTASIFFLTLPKWIVSPEFCNQQLWYWILLCLFVYQYYQTGKTISVILAGFALCMTVLSYPSSVLLFIPYLVLLYKKNHKAAVIFTLTCVISGVLFILFILSYMKPSELFTNISYIINDPSHANGFSEKISKYFFDFSGQLYRLILYLSAGVLFVFIRFMIQKSKKATILEILFVSLLVAMADQLRLWITGVMPNVHPQLHYLILFLIGFALKYQNKFPKKKDRNLPDLSDHERLLLSIFWSPAPIGLFSVLLLTNLDILGSLVHLLPGLLAVLLILAGRGLPSRKAATSLLFCFAFLLTFADIYLIRIEWNRPANMFITRQKALSGPVKNIYCPYMIGYEYNEEIELLTSALPRNAKVFYAGDHFPMTYLMNRFDVCSASTISTPVFDQRYLDYFEVNPGKIPEYAVIEKKYFEQSMSDENPVKKWLLRSFDWNSAVENEFIIIVPYAVSP